MSTKLPSDKGLDSGLTWVNVSRTCGWHSETGPWAVCVYCPHSSDEVSWRCCCTSRDVWFGFHFCGYLHSVRENASGPNGHLGGLPVTALPAGSTPIQPLLLSSAQNTMKSSGQILGWLHTWSDLKYRQTARRRGLKTLKRMKVPTSKKKKKSHEPHSSLKGYPPLPCL